MSKSARCAPTVLSAERRRATRPNLLDVRAVSPATVFRDDFELASCRKVPGVQRPGVPFIQNCSTCAAVCHRSETYRFRGARSVQSCPVCRTTACHSSRAALRAPPLIKGKVETSASEFGVAARLSKSALRAPTLRKSTTHARCPKLHVWRTRCSEVGIRREKEHVYNVADPSEVKANPARFSGFLRMCGDLHIRFGGEGKRSCST